MSIFSSLRYCLGNPSDLSNLWAALAFMPFGLFFDFMDGKVARWRGKSSLMGQELDSLADLVCPNPPQSNPTYPAAQRTALLTKEPKQVSFGVAPAVAAFTIGMRTSLDHVLLTFFFLCGLLRLARFNVTAGEVPHDASGKAKYFEGVPIPMSLSIVALMSFWVSKGWILAGVPFGTIGSGLLEFHPAVLLFVAHGCMMVSKTLHVPKP